MMIIIIVYRTVDDDDDDDYLIRKHFNQSFVDLKQIQYFTLFCLFLSSVALVNVSYMRLLQLNLSIFTVTIYFPYYLKIVIIPLYNL